MRGETLIGRGHKGLLLPSEAEEAQSWLVEVRSAASEPGSSPGLAASAVGKLTLTGRLWGAASPGWGWQVARPWRGVGRRGVVGPVCAGDDSSAAPTPLV